jgi:hypothetical protein
MWNLDLKRDRDMEGEGGLFGKGLAASGQEDGGQERVKLKG